ncbi:MAG: hypothetical protein DCC71_07115 [Proteobacteria bacterium]|nr:MAG: hypothetical protein DCC71_07115 [Pseudomonadota bacterium]
MAKTKGTTLVSLVKFLRSQHEKARPRLAPSLHHYLDERIHPSSWYPEEDLLALIRVMLALLPGARDANLERMGEIIAREHLEGIYGHLKSEEPHTLVRRAVALWASQHDSGSLRIDLHGDDGGTFSVQGFALPSDEMCRIFQGYFAETMRVAGWTDVRVQKAGCVLAGADACTWHASWRAPH